MIEAAIAAHRKAADGAASAIVRLLDEIRENHPEHYERVKVLVPDALREGLDEQA